MNQDWSQGKKGKKSRERGKNSYNPSNQQNGVHEKSSNNTLEVQNKQGKTDIRRKIFVKKSNKLNETLQQCKLRTNRKEICSVMKRLRCLTMKSKPDT